MDRTQDPSPVDKGTQDQSIDISLDKSGLSDIGKDKLVLPDKKPTNPDKSKLNDIGKDKLVLPDKKPTNPDKIVYLDMCTCIPEKDWGQWRNCNCPQVKWGCTNAPQNYSGICDLKPECWDVEMDTITGCPKPTTKCSKSCLTTDMFVNFDQGPDK